MITILCLINSNSNHRSLSTCQSNLSHHPDSFELKSLACQLKKYLLADTAPYCALDLKGQTGWLTSSQDARKTVVIEVNHVSQQAAELLLLQGCSRQPWHMQPHTTE